MGQNAIGIFYGCKANDIRLREEDEEGPGLLDAWEAIPGHGKGQLWLDDHYPEAGATLVGFWVALSGDFSEKPGAVELAQSKLTDWPKSKRGRQVTEGWPQVKAVARKLGMKLGRPAFWVVETEVA